MRFTLLALALLVPATSFAAPPPAEFAALKKLRRMTTNVQFHRSNGRVRLVRLSKSLVSDETLSHFKAFKEIDYLAVVCPKVTDAGLAHIAGLTKLDTLVLSETSITSDGLKQLAKLSKLERLYLVNTKIDDAAFKYLVQLKSLKTLSLERTQVTDAGLRNLKQLPNLELLVLADTKITDAGLKHLASLKNLTTLDLNGCRITGDGLVALKSLPKLKYLNLTDTQVTDQLAAKLKGFKKLKTVVLHRTQITANGLRRLRTALPKTGFASGIDLVGNGNTQTKNSTNQAPRVSSKLHASIRTRLKAKEKFTPDFQRHVIPLLGRLGCNGRSCHGSFQGQGGFRLSMFGYNFDLDHKNLSKRINLKAPDKSLILNKPTNADDHGGGLRLPPGGWEQQLLRQWITGGAKGLPKNPPTFARLEITPRELLFKQTGETRQLKAIAVWSNGLREDVTALTRFETKNDAVADVSPDGMVTSKGKGDTHILSYYDNGLIATPVIRPVGDLANYPKVPTPTKIDELVVRKLRKLGVRPSNLCTDEDFLRRVGLDLIGTLPTPAEIRAFKADKSKDKRTKKIDELLARPEYVTLWTNRLCDLTQANAGYLGGTEMARPVATQWERWMQRRVEKNVGWDKIVAGIVLATSRKPGQPYREFIAEQSKFTKRKGAADFAALGNPMPHFWFRSNIARPEDKALAFGYTFMGVRLNCAQCHKHPFDQWSKRDFELFTQFFIRIKSGLAPDAVPRHDQMRAMLGVPVKLNTAALRRQSYLRIAAEGRPIPWREIYIEAPRSKVHRAKLLGDRELNLSDYSDPRKPLMKWLLTEPNHYLAKAFVNRIWASYFNVGIVDPPDDLNLANPPSNGPLLDYLTTAFIKSGYDMKWLHRTITTSRTYQLSWRPNETNKTDERNFNRSVIRRLPAEVAVDAMIQATASSRVLKYRGIKLAQRKIGQHPKSYQTRSIDYALLIFGKSLRSTNCDCERAMDPTLPQALYMKNDQESIARLNRPDGWLAELKKRKLTAKDVDGLIREAYLRVLSREPDKRELADCRGHVKQSKTIAAGMSDLLWALLNTQEFITNH